jgi:hypothetical protein
MEFCKGNVERKEKRPRVRKKRMKSKPGSELN